MRVLDPSDIHERVPPGWRIMPGSLATVVRTGSMVTGVEFITRILQVAEERNHHPDVTLGYPRVVITLTTHDAGGITERDLDLATAIGVIAREMELPLYPDSVTALQVAIDALEIEEVRPFWRAVLGYVDGPEEGSLADPLGIGPLVWFQPMDAPRAQRNRIHLDVYVPEDLAAERVRDALAAGGRLIDEAAAPSWWVLADTEGNEACVCTWQEP